MTGPEDRDYDDALSSIRNGAQDLAVALAIWETRNEPDAYARRCASDAVDAIDAALRDLHSVRQQLVSEIREADDATAARADALLAGRARDQELPGASRPGDDKAGR
jgi:Ser/Thr protein kinase RdoA (MazF antagonist)